MSEDEDKTPVISNTYGAGSVIYSKMINKSVFRADQKYGATAAT
jgi:hypothetical protein